MLVFPQRCLSLQEDRTLIPDNLLVHSEESIGISQARSLSQSQKLPEQLTTGKKYYQSHEPRQALKKRHLLLTLVVSQFNYVENISLSLIYSSLENPGCTIKPSCCKTNKTKSVFNEIIKKYLFICRCKPNPTCVHTRRSHPSQGYVDASHFG